MCSVGSRFCQKAESNYSPTEGEFTALVEGLEKTAFFTLGCAHVSVGTDHKPLIPIINNTDLSSVKTPRQHRLRERLLRWNLSAQYIPGKLLGGTDALSRYGVRDVEDETVNWMSDLHRLLAEAEEENTWHEESLSGLKMQSPPISYNDVALATQSDKVMNDLAKTIENGFPRARVDLPKHLQPYWRVREMLSVNDGVIFMGDRIVVPDHLIARVLDTLHSAHQGTTSMRLRAEQSLYWPGMARAIARKRQSCQSCDITAPSQSSEPPITPETPEYPFQHVATDYFTLGGHNFLLVVDRFSNWLQVYRGDGGSSNLIRLLGDLFHSFGISESLTSDGGPQYTAEETREFLRKLGVKHRISSVGFPHSNQKAERSVGAAKRLLRDTVRPSGDIDTTSLIKGLLQLRNTPDQDTGLSPAQLLLGRNLRDFLPRSPRKSSIRKFDELGSKFRDLSEWRELALGPRQARMHERLKQGTKELPPLKAGDYVMIQNQLGNKPKQWGKRGVVVQAHPEIRQYKVMAFGSRRLSLRNRKFLRRYEPIHVPDNAPLGLPKRLKTVLQQQKVTSQTVPTRQRTTTPSPEVSLDCEPSCCKSQQPGAWTQATTKVQRQSQPATLDIPVVDTSRTEVDLTTPVCTSETTLVSAEHAPVTSGTVPITSGAVPGTTETPTKIAEPRRSARVGKGMTHKYDDYVQPLLDSTASEVDMLWANQLSPTMYYTEPAYNGEPPTGMYNTRYPYNLVIFRNPIFLPTLIRNQGA